MKYFKMLLVVVIVVVLGIAAETMLHPSQILQTGAQTGQGLIWTGNKYEPAFPDWSQLVSIPNNIGAWQMNGTRLYYNNGNVGVGINNPVFALDVESASTTKARFGIGSSSSFMRVHSNNTGISGILLGDTDDFDVGRINYEHDINYMRFYTNGGIAMSINSSRSLGIGVGNASEKLDVNGKIRTRDISEYTNPDRVAVYGEITNDVIGYASGYIWREIGNDYYLRPNNVNKLLIRDDNQMYLFPVLTDPSIVFDGAIINNLTDGKVKITNEGEWKNIAFEEAIISRTVVPHDTIITTKIWNDFAYNLPSKYNTWYLKKVEIHIMEIIGTNTIPLELYDSRYDNGTQFTDVIPLSPIQNQDTYSITTLSRQVSTSDRLMIRTSNMTWGTQPATGMEVHYYLSPNP